MTIKVEKFGEVLRRVFGSLENVPTKVGIGLSGGPDSMLLSWLLKTTNEQLMNNRLKIHAITIDHSFRAGSKVEAQKLTPTMNNWGIKHSIKSLDYGDADPKLFTNFEEIARIKRFEALNDLCCEQRIPFLFLGHHKDDQVETFVQRLQGNSSIYGLAGTRQVSPLPSSRDLPPLETKDGQVFLVRPLLDFYKDDIVKTCELHNIPYVIDPTNKNPKLTRRNFLRQVFGVTLPHMLNKHENGNNKSTSRHDTPNPPPPTTFPYANIMKEELAAAHNECVSLVETFEDKANLLHQILVRNGHLKKEPAIGKLSVELPRELLLNPNNIVTSRFFYQILYPYCTLNHYHWAYAKLERLVLPRMEAFVRAGNLGSKKFSLMNFIFHVTYNALSPTVFIEITHAPHSRCELQKYRWQQSVMNGAWSKWRLFGKRYWLSFKCNTPHEKMDIEVVPYDHKSMKTLIDESLRDSIDSFKFNTSLNTLPVVFFDGTIVSFPTLGYESHTLQLRWKIKENRFGYNSAFLSSIKS
ncbi:hypothetical protein LELG_04833 [Lodderomyces elongisporus NRRL YB-4239]|uniref:tRNA(Ile)-lysidine synthetase n=1 Tax=Lodderomyces elongisporus (strain ATCC 11503 / CBS 2605 / JCM 1781 / NBRC 1676 / NRRL YB-4239) TaxID=379508 RepID=A5E5E4_LODEL|nr:hypothetical protein LELG_04833 [Lodderomyces elongisporus NRRL YB-4239]